MINHTPAATTLHPNRFCVLWFVQGSCTACILTVHETSLRVANVGDSGFLVVRSGKVLFRSQSQQHDFNFPYQLGGEGSDSPQVRSRIRTVEHCSNTVVTSSTPCDPESTPRGSESTPYVSESTPRGPDSTP